MIWLSYNRPNKMAIFSWYCNVYITLRLSFRNMEAKLGLLPIEDEENMDEEEEIDNLNLSIMLQSTCIIFAIIHLFNSFEATTIKNCVAYTVVLLAGLAIMFGLHGTKGMTNLYAVTFFGFLSICYLLRIMQEGNIESFKNFK